MRHPRARPGGPLVGRHVLRCRAAPFDTQLDFSP